MQKSNSLITGETTLRISAPHNLSSPIRYSVNVDCFHPEDSIAARCTGSPSLNIDHDENHFPAIKKGTWSLA